MNTGQQLFRDFIMQGALPGKESALEDLLTEGFDRQAAGTFDRDYVNEVTPKYTELLRPEHHEGFKNAAEHILSTLAV